MTKLWITVFLIFIYLYIYIYIQVINKTQSYGMLKNVGPVVLTFPG